MEATYGICWEPDEFVRKAVEMGHPAHFLDGVPWMLRDTIDRINTQTTAAMAVIGRLP